MSNVVAFKGPQNVEGLAALHRPLQPSFRASLGVSVRRWWHRARLSVEAVGWIVVAASLIAAIR